MECKKSRQDSKPARSIINALGAAFRKGPDSAGILQGRRKFRSGRPHVWVSLVPSRKNGDVLMPCEGRLEAALAKCLELDPDVSEYRCQPIRIKNPGGREFVIDFASRDRLGRYTLYDVKPFGKLDDPRVANRMRTVRSRLSLAQLPHLVVTERELETDPQRQVRDSLFRGLFITTTDYLKARKAVLGELGRRSVCVGEARRIAVRNDAHPLLIERMVIDGQLNFSVSTLWSDYTNLEVFNECDSKSAAGWCSIRDVRIGV